jgi:uncharacterized protein YciI
MAFEGFAQGGQDVDAVFGGGGQVAADRLRSLRDSGVLLMAGPYDGWREDPDRSCPTGMVILAVPEDKAREIAEADPLVRGGAQYVFRRWNRTF